MVALGTFSAGAAERAQELRTGLPLASFAASGRGSDQEMRLLVQRLARHGLLEYPLRRARDEDAVVIEPQVADYWPATPRLREADVLVLSRFAYLRRRGDAIVLESPRAGALFRICDPQLAGAIATLSTPQQIRRLRAQKDFPGSSCSRCCWTAASCSRSMPASAACDRARATTTSYSGTFTICCSTRAARRAGTPTRWARLVLMRAS